MPRCHNPRKSISRCNLSANLLPAHPSREEATSRPEEEQMVAEGREIEGSSPHVESKMQGGWSVEGHLLYPRLSGLQLFI